MGRGRYIRRLWFVKAHEKLCLGKKGTSRDGGLGLRD